MKRIVISSHDDLIWDTWWVDGFPTIDKIAKKKREKKTGDKKKHEYTKRSNKKHMGTI